MTASNRLGPLLKDISGHVIDRAVDMGAKILVVGATGLLGPYVVDSFASLGEVYGVSRRSKDYPYDFTKENEVSACISKYTPDCLVLLAACTDVDNCETDPKMAMRANRLPATLVARHLARDRHFIYISTDQVYPDRPGPHSEEDVAPVNMYGRSKREGEIAALTHPMCLVLRTNMFGPSRTKKRVSLSDFFREKLEDGKEFKLFQNLCFSPLHCQTIADYIKKCFDVGLTGVFNLGSNSGMSKKDFALTLAEMLGLDASKAKTVNSSSIDGRAVRATDLRLNVTKIETALQVTMPTLKDEIRKLCQI